MSLSSSIQDSYLQKEKTYWLEKLAGELHRSGLPVDFGHRVSLPGIEAILEFSFDPDITGKILEACRGNDALLFAILVGGLKICLHKYTGIEDIVVGSAIYERHKSAAFSNQVLILRDRISDDMTTLQALEQIRRTIADAYANQRYPYDKLRRVVGANKTEEALFRVAIALKTIHNPENLIGLGQDVTFQFAGLGNKLAAELRFNPARVRRETCEQFVGHYEHVLREMLNFPERSIARAQLYSLTQKQQLLRERNRSAKQCQRDPTITALFEEQARRTPAAIGLRYEQQSLTYHELNTKANQWAHFLRSKGAGPEIAIAISIDRSPEMIIGLLAILKAGAVYVPLDLEYPLERQEIIFRDSGAKLLLATHDRVGGRPQGVEVVPLDKEPAEIARQSQENPAGHIRPDNLAYIMYTSGSTGAPKGVAVTHRAVVRLLQEANYVELGPDEKILQFAPLSFDASTFEIWGSLLHGGELIVMSAGQSSLEALAATVRTAAISTMWLSAGLFQLMVDHCLEELKGVRQLLVGGDVVSVAHAQKYLGAHPHATLIDGYGPTENTTFTCCYSLQAETEIGSSIPIGTPISNTEVYIVDHHFDPVPVGVVGELYAGGEGLARGYISEPELTAEKFVPNPFSERGKRLYRTGDLARYSWSGSIEFVGRADQQVKIRGYRIELGEIEATLGKHEGVRASVVLIEESGSGDKRLTAYVVARQNVTTLALKKYLEQKLPAHMLPSLLVQVTEMPLTQNGKIDRARLAEQKTDSPDPEQKELYVAPRNPLEETMAELWKEVLGVERVGMFDNFFDLGGHSLLAMKVCARMKGRLPCQAKVTDLFLHPTIDALARHLGGSITESAVQVSRAIRGASLDGC